MITAETYAALLRVDVGFALRHMRVLKEATGEDGSRRDLFPMHKRGGADNTTPEASHLFNFILSLLVGQPADVVEAVLAMLGWVQGDCYTIRSEDRTVTVREQRNALLAFANPNAPATYERPAVGRFVEVLDSVPLLQAATLKDYGCGEIECLAGYTPDERQKWMERAKDDKIEVDLGAGVATISRVLRRDDQATLKYYQLFVSPQPDLLGGDHEDRVERIVRLPLRYLGVAAELLANFRAKRGGSLDLPPAGSEPSAEPENENASDLPGSEADTQPDNQHRNGDTGTEYNTPENRARNSVSQSCSLSSSRKLVQPPPMLELRAT
jgi:hypothetical protein